MAALSSLTGKIGTIFQATPSNNLTGGVYNAISTSVTILKNQSMGTANGNTTAGGADQVFSFRQAISAASSVTIDLIAMTNLLANAAVAVVRIKGIQIRLLSAADDSTISPAPTATTTVTVTNIGPATPCCISPLASTGSGLTVALTGAGAVTAVAIGAAGTLYPRSTFLLASPQQAGGSACVFLVTTNSSGVPTAVTFIAGAGGAGYSAATVPTTIVGQFRLTTGNASCYVDVTGAGDAVSATGNNLRIINADATNACSIELDCFCGTT